MKKEKIVIGIMLSLCIIFTIGIVILNGRDKQQPNIIEAENENIDIEEEKEELVVPPITSPKKDKDDNLDKPEYKEEVKEIDGNKVLVKPTPLPKEYEKLPEGIETPKTEPKPTNPPKPVNTETTDKKDNKIDKPKDQEKPPAYKKEEKPKVVNGGTGSDGVVRDLKGNPTGLKPATNVEEVNGSDLGEPGDPEMGQGDKF